MSVEEPPFHIRFREGSYEVRDYPALVVAEVIVNGAQDQAANSGFRILAAYIFGQNARRQVIAMTAPVTLLPQIDEVGHVAAKGVGAWTVQFAMPQGVAADALPAPADARVHLRATLAARLAVIQFSGVAHPRAFEARAAELSAWVAQRGLRARGTASLAQYDPPWTLWFLRRNEVMIPVTE